MIISLLLIFISHPLSIGLILLLQTITISLITGNINYNIWYSYILFLIIIGGILILFIYMTRVASNEKFKLNYKILILFIIILIPNTENFRINLNNETLIFNKSLIINISFRKFLFTPSFYIINFIILYLFITLIAIVKITEFNKGPLRTIE